MEQQKDQFIHSVDFLSQQQIEMEAIVNDMEKSLGLGEWSEMKPIELPDPSVATRADLQRQALYFFMLFLSEIFDIYRFISKCLKKSRLVTSCLSF